MQDGYLTLMLGSRACSGNERSTLSRSSSGYGFSINNVTPKKNMEGDIRDQIIPILGLLQSTKSHLRTGDVFLGVLEVLELWRYVRLTTSPESCQAS